MSERYSNSDIESVATSGPITNAPRDRYILVWGPTYKCWKSAVWNPHVQVFAENKGAVNPRTYPNATHWMNQPSVPNLSNDTPPRVTYNMRDFRKRLGLTLIEAGHFSGVPYKTIIGLEQNELHEIDEYLTKSQRIQMNVYIAWLEDVIQQAICEKDTYGLPKWRGLQSWMEAGVE